MRSPTFKTLHLKKEALQFLYDALETKGLVRIEKFGVFTIKRMKPRRLYHYFSDKFVVLGGHNKLHFRPYTKTKEKIQNYKTYYNA